MAERIFLAGAGGRRRPQAGALLRDAGHAVYGTTRKREVAAWLQATGIDPVVVDVFDAPALCAALRTSAPGS